MASIVEIPLRKRKTAGIYTCLILSFVAIAGFSTLTRYLLLYFLPGVGLSLLMAILSCLLFLFFLWAAYRSHKEGNTGLYISDLGITDVSTGYQVGAILWEDITRLKVMDDLEYPEYKYVVLDVKDPGCYIAHEPTRMKRRTLTLKLHQYGSPICISNRALACSFEELYHLIETRYQAYQEHQASIAQK